METEATQAVRDAASQAAAAGWVRLAHVLGAMIYGGGLLVVAKMLAGLARVDPKARPPAAAALRRVYLGLVFPGLLVLLLAGLHTAFMDPAGAEYLKQPWFHMKLTVALLILIVDHMMVGRPLKGFAKGTADPRTQESMYAAPFWILALLIFALTVALYVIRK
jgi:uncharacterized membrane protein